MFLMPTNSALRNWWNRTSYHTTITMSLLLHLHSLLECLVWVKKCCHVWLDHFDPSLPTSGCILESQLCTPWITPGGCRCLVLGSSLLHKNLWRNWHQWPQKRLYQISGGFICTSPSWLSVTSSSSQCSNDWMLLVQMSFRWTSKEIGPE